MWFEPFHIKFMISYFSKLRSSFHRSVCCCCFVVIHVFIGILHPFASYSSHVCQFVRVSGMVSCVVGIQMKSFVCVSLRSFLLQFSINETKEIFTFSFSFCRLCVCVHAASQLFRIDLSAIVSGITAIFMDDIPHFL